MKTFSAEFLNEPWRERKFRVRGICKHDVLNPCWDDRPDDVPGEHWSGLGPACEPCTNAAIAASSLHSK